MRCFTATRFRRPGSTRLPLARAPDRRCHHRHAASDIETDRRHRPHKLALLQIVGLNSAHIDGIHRVGEEPSTASGRMQRSGRSHLSDRVPMQPRPGYARLKPARVIKECGGGISSRRSAAQPRDRSRCGRRSNYWHRERPATDIRNEKRERHA